MICHFSSLFFIKTKDEKSSAFVCLFFFFLFMEIMEKLFATLVIFSFFLLKWNYGKLGDSYAIFLFFHFLNTMEKMKKWCE